MPTNKKHQRLIKVLVIVATIALLLTTFIPMLFYII